MSIICYKMIQMDDLIESAELLAFTKTVDAKSLTRAASELSVPRATISRRLARLEERLGVRLLRRTTRSLVLTDAGEAFYRHARIALDTLSQAQQSVRTDSKVLRGELRVSAPPFASDSFCKLICDFVESQPAVNLQVHLSTQHVDLRARPLRRRDSRGGSARAGSDQSSAAQESTDRARFAGLSSGAWYAAHAARSAAPPLSARLRAR